MRRVESLSLLATVLFATACGVQNAAVPGAASPAPSASPPAGERLVVESRDATRLIDTGSGATVATLPAGTLAPTRDLIVAVKAEGATTRLHGTYLSGKRAPDIVLSGAYQLSDAYGAAPSGFSPNGKWLVLSSRDTTESRFAIVDVARWVLDTTVTLEARFSFDAIHNDGSAMYLIERPRPGTTSYNVRLYDVRANVLKPDLIFDKAAISQFDPSVGLMDGTFHVSVAPTTGEWSYGLYMRSNGTPFVHALNVPGRYATCILDLAGTWTPSSMFSMALSQGAKWLYVVDAAGGAVSVIDAERQKMTRRATFATRGGGDPRAAAAVLSRDGTRLYATGAQGVAVLQTADLALRGWIATDLAARSLALSSDGARLYALSGDAIHVVDAASGRVTARLAAAPNARAIHLLARADLVAVP